MKVYGIYAYVRQYAHIFCNLASTSDIKVISTTSQSRDAYSIVPTMAETSAIVSGESKPKFSPVFIIESFLY